MSNQLICSSLLIAAVLLMTIEGFPIVPWGSKTATTTISRQQRTFFASAPVVFMSETAEEATTASDATDVTPTDTAPVAASTEFEMTPEEAAAKRKVQRERNTLFVGNLPFDVTESTIKALFEPHGKVDLVNIPRDRMTQKPRGFAFVDMSTAEELEAAISAVDGTHLENRSVRVMKSVNKDEVGERKAAAPKRERSNTGASNGPPAGTKKIYVGNIPFSVTKDELKDLYSEYGEVVDVYIPPNPETGEGRGFAFVTMKEEDFLKAIEGTNGVEFGGRTLVVNEPLPPGKKAPTRGKSNGTKLYVGNLSFYTVVQTLYDIFGEFGEVLDCYLPEDSATGSSRGFGFVTMAPEDAARAIKEIDGCEVDGRVIRVNEAQPKGRPASNYNNDMGAEEMGVISDSWNNMDDQ